ncbi:hypothetical protein D9758_008366 [Tetrapyrgos nigripes]|uniref:DDE-1 domain-containing protein n=1 Tax=Tetrapyrgos nigripes TaxID=182062 RepID=A0A8H5GDX6_9AGAR|nr:hypothetical protein D9758_008366 [Tetrapyrgos nigripes]
MAENHPNIIIVYMPGNCTGIFQPADVGLQHVLKHQLKQELFQHLVEQQRVQIKAGIKLEDASFNTKLGPLRDGTVGALVKAWEKSETKQYNLCDDCVCSAKSFKALNNYLKTHPKLYDEISLKTGTVEKADAEDDELYPDDTDIPLSAITQTALGMEIGADQIPFTSNALYVHFDSQDSWCDAWEEDLLSYNNDGSILPTSYLLLPE